MASMYSDAVDTFNSGYNGYKAVLIGQKQRQLFRETGVMPTKREVCEQYEHKCVRN